MLKRMAWNASHRDHHMSKVETNMLEKYIEVGYEDKVVFMLKEEDKVHSGVRTTWQRSQGLWAHHPVFRGMTTKEIVEWLRGGDWGA